MASGLISERTSGSWCRQRVLHNVCLGAREYAFHGLGVWRWVSLDGPRVIRGEAQSKDAGFI
jgi:hypothetical protein